MGAFTPLDEFGFHHALAGTRGIALVIFTAQAAAVAAPGNGCSPRIAHSILISRCLKSMRVMPRRWHASSTCSTCRRCFCTATAISIVRCKPRHIRTNCAPPSRSRSSRRRRRHRKRKLLHVLARRTHGDIRFAHLSFQCQQESWPHDSLRHWPAGPFPPGCVPACDSSARPDRGDSE